MGSNDKAETVVLSVGGSLVVPNGGIDIDFLKKMNVFIRSQVRDKQRRFLIVIGGGRTARHYRDAAKDVIGTIGDEDLDWIGIHATRLNGHIFRTIFQDIAHPRIIENYDRQLRNWNEPIAIGAGWKPGWSTDYCSVVLARDYNASVIINLSNIDYVFDKDPSVFKDAKKITKTTWSYFEKLVGTEWKPGINAPFDPVASQLAKRLGTTVIVANGKNFSNLNKILSGENFKGTVITNYRIDASFYDRNYYEGKKNEYRMPLTESFLGNLLLEIVNLYRALWIKLFINPKNVLDIGCGTGKLIKYLRRLGIQAYGIEISNYALGYAEKETRPFIQKGDITKIPYDDNSFDLVTSIDVLEHIERAKIKIAVEEAVRVSKRLMLHKIYTVENSWIKITHRKDFSHVSILSQGFWFNLFKSIDNISLVRKFAFKLPIFFESLFLLRKK